ncbi:hypothetical protein GGR56DRAFT_665204 [Xylariaceae sp. FL0804]|nr:hypothetical protein GGR56DRAFT_665204 [Xylariaceae sp. FL0804]
MSKVDVVQRPAATATTALPPLSLPAALVTSTTASTTSTTNKLAPATPLSSSTGSTSASVSASACDSTSTSTTTSSATTIPRSSAAHHQRSPPPPPLPPPLPHSGSFKRSRPADHRDRDARSSKTRVRTVAKKSMEPPVLSFYGSQPVPLPSRFAQLKRRLVAGHEPALEASWARLVAALRDEIRHIERRGSGLIPSLDFADMDDAARVAPFGERLKRHGIGVIRGVVPPADARAWVDETRTYLETKHEFKPPPAQDPTCFDFFWTPAQVRARAHPHVLRAQRFAMSLWETNDDDRLATRFPITYADRVRIETVAANGSLTVNGAVTAVPVAAAAPQTPEDSLIAAAAAASSAQIAQVDNGSLERWEQDGYGRCGLYDAIFRGDWESYNEWNPAGRINATSDLYNGAGACSMMRLFQGILALTVVEPGMIRLLPSPKLSTAYFLLRPLFSPRQGPPEPTEGGDSADDDAAWEAYLDPANWTVDREQSTIIHGAVPGHAQRVTAPWHPHLQLHRSLVTPPTLQAGDYIIWHPDQAYQFSNTNYRTSSRPTPSSSSAAAEAAGGSHHHHHHSSSSSSSSNSSGGGGGATSTSMLVYTPAAPLTQTNALFLARQRKAFLRGHPGPDFDSTGTGLGSEAPHTGRLGEKEIAEVGGEEGLQAMGLAPWSLADPKQQQQQGENSSSKVGTPMDEQQPKDVEMGGSGDRGDTSRSSSSGSAAAPFSSVVEKAAAVANSTVTHAEAEVVRLANIILFPDRYDFYMPTRASSPVPARDKEKA